MKYRPWSGDIANAWGHEGMIDQEIKDEWEGFVSDLQSEGLPVPDVLRHEIDCFLQNRREMERQGHADPDGNVVDNGVDADGLPFEENTDEYDDSWMNLSRDGSGVSAVDPDLDCDVEVQWDRNKDWSETEHELGGTNWGDVAERFSDMVQNFTHAFQQKIVCREDLKE